MASVKKAQHINADLVKVGDLVHVPAFINAPNRVDPVTGHLVDFEKGRVTIEAAGHSWSMGQYDLVKVTKA